MAAMRGVGALLLDLNTCSSAEEEVPPGSLVRSAATAHDGDDYESWAAEHGFAPAPAYNVPGSLGIRVLASAPVPAPEAELQRRLFWEDPVLGGWGLGPGLNGTRLASLSFRYTPHARE